MPTFSIIMPVYNNEKYFPKAVKSVLQQDFKDFELIIVDDGSTDKTPDLADEMAESDSHIRVIHQNNQWIYASFNNGIAAAAGDYIYILNSDDKIRPGVLKLMASKIETFHPDVIWTKVLTHDCDADQNIIKYDKYSLDGRIQEEQFFKNKEEVRGNWLYLMRELLVQNQANLYRRDIMLKHIFRNDVYGADTLFNISIASGIESALVLKEPVYDHFVYHQENMNASVGKYYPYEHDMFNEIYLNYIGLFQSWGMQKDEYEPAVGHVRMVNLTTEIHSLMYKNCNLTTEEKIKHIFCKVVDDTVYQCAQHMDCIEELESRILSGTREILLQEQLPENSKMYFVYRLLESLLRYEKDEVDFKRIKYAVHHPLNKYQVGKCFWNKLTGESI